jgi:hypothetical protein
MLPGQRTGRGSGAAPYMHAKLKQIEVSDRFALRQVPRVIKLARVLTMRIIGEGL